MPAATIATAADITGGIGPSSARYVADAAPVASTDVAALKPRLYQRIRVLRKRRPMIVAAPARSMAANGGMSSAAAKVGMSSTVIFTFVERWSGQTEATLAITRRIAATVSSL